MARFSVCQKTGLRRGAWTLEEDKLLVAFIARHGHSNWRLLPKHAGLARDGKSCRLRWMNYLRPDLKRGCFTAEEDEIIISMLQRHGNRWSVIAQNLPGRTDNEIKNHWHTHLKKLNVTVEETNLRSVDESGILTPLYTRSNSLSPLDFSWLFEMINPNNQVVEHEVILDVDGEFGEENLPQESAVVVDHPSGEFFIPQLEEVFSPYEVCSYNEIEMSSTTRWFSIGGTPDEFARFWI